MAANSFPTGTPVSRVKQFKTNTVARTDTTVKLLFVLPKGSQITDIKFYADTGSDAATTAVVKVGTSTSATEIVASQSVKGAAGAGVIYPSVASGQLYTTLTGDTPIYAIYAETGTASTTGGSWTVEVGYVVLGPGKQ